LLFFELVSDLPLACFFFLNVPSPAAT